MIKRLEQLIFDNWDKLNLPKATEKPKKFSFFVNSIQHCIMIFNDRDKNPVCVVKFYKGDKRNFGEREYNNLSYVYNAASPLLKLSLPKPILLENIDEYRILLETTVRGRRVSEVIESHRPYLGNIRFSQYISMIADWLELFQKDTQIAEITLKQEDLEKYLLKHVNLFCINNIASEVEKRYFDEYTNKARSALGCKIPLVSSHSDFWLGNILFENNRMGVIDWVDLSKEDMPFWDLFQFISTFRLQKDLKNVLNSINYSLYESNWFSKIIREFSSSYCSRMQIDSKIIKLFYPIFLIKSHSISQNNCSIRDQFWRQQLQYYIENQDSFIL